MNNDKKYCVITYNDKICKWIIVYYSNDKNDCKQMIENYNDVYSNRYYFSIIKKFKNKIVRHYMLDF